MKYSLIKAGDVILTAGTNPFIKLGNVLRGRCDGIKWTHAAISLGEKALVESVQEEGIRLSDLDKEYTQKGVDFVVLRCRCLSDSDRAAVANYCSEKKGEPYDWRALSYFVFNGLFPTLLGPILCFSFVEKLLNVENSYFCSELVSEGYMTENIRVADTDPYKIMPVDFLNTKLFDIIQI